MPRGIRMRKESAGYRFRHRQPIDAAALERVALHSPRTPALSSLRPPWLNPAQTIHHWSSSSSCQPGTSPPVGRSHSSPGSTLQHFTIRPLTTNLCRCSNARHDHEAESPESSAVCSAFWSILPPRATAPPKPDLRPHTARSRISPAYAQRPESDP